MNEIYVNMLNYNLIESIMSSSPYLGATRDPEHIIKVLNSIFYKGTDTKVISIEHSRNYAGYLVTLQKQSVLDIKQSNSNFRWGKE